MASEYTLETYTHEDVEWLAEGHRVRLVYDVHYQTVGSYAYDTEEETKEAEDYEIAQLEKHEWVALGRIEEKPCNGECGGWIVVDSLWGIVVDNTAEGYQEAATL